jgi:hypothetical protein
LLRAISGRRADSKYKKCAEPCGSTLAVADTRGGPFRDRGDSVLARRRKFTIASAVLPLLAAVVVVALGLVPVSALLGTPTTTTLASDTFRRSNQAPWGTASDGHVWGASASARGFFSIVKNAGQVGATNGSSYSGILGGTAADEDVEVTGSLSSFQDNNFGPVARWADGDDWYKAYPDGNSLILQRKVSGTASTLGAVAFTAKAKTAYTIELQVIGSALSARIWQSGATQPGWMVTATDSALTVGYTGLRVLVQIGSSAKITGFVGKALHGNHPPTGSSSTTTSATTSTSTTTVPNTPSTTVTPTGGSVAIDYTHEVGIDPRAFGIDETGYQAPNVLPNDALEMQRFQTLGTRYVRMDLRYSTPGDPTSKIVCGGSGCDTGPTGDQWIAAIKQVGAVPVVIVPTATPQDDANLVAHFKGQVGMWLIGNEPDINGYSAATYTADWNADASAMRAVDPTIEIGGPTTAWFDQPFVTTFLQSAHAPDFIDFHAYPTQYSQSFLFSWAAGTGDGVAHAHALAQQYLGHDVPVEVGEWSLDWGNNTCTRSNLNTVWSADVLGQILRNGGISLHYGTKGNMLEWGSGTFTNCDTGQSVYEPLDDPHAPYEGYTMFTGAGLFPGFGTAIAACRAPAGVDCFASDGGSHDVVLVNTGTASVNATLPAAGDVWQRAPGLAFNAPPTHLGTLSSVDLPPVSATTVVLP